MARLRPGDPSLSPLYRRALASPLSLTRAERNTIFDKPPPDEEDALCVARTGLTLAALTAKAYSTPDDLRRLELEIMTSSKGVNYKSVEEETAEEAEARWAEMTRRAHAHAGPPSEVEVLWEEAVKALNAVMGEEEKTARANARRVRYAIVKAEMDAQYWREVEFFRARRLKQGSGWMRKMLQNGLLDEGKLWGFVVFRTGCYGGGEEDEAAWRRFREHFDTVAEAVVLHYNSGPELWPSFRAVFVEMEELEGATDEELRARFRKMREGGELPRGTRTSCFLVADRAVIESEAAQVPFVPRYYDMSEASMRIEPDDKVVYIRAVDPDKEATVDAIASRKKNSQEAAENSKGDGMTGYTGEATVALPRVFDWLHCVCFCAERGLSRRAVKVEWHNERIHVEGWEPVERAEGWRTIHIQTRSGEPWIRNWDPNTGNVDYVSWERQVRVRTAPVIEKQIMSRGGQRS